MKLLDCCVNIHIESSKQLDFSKMLSVAGQLKLHVRNDVIMHAFLGIIIIVKMLQCFGACAPLYMAQYYG